MKSVPYRIRLSKKGFEAYLACHYRLGRLTQTFVSYGATLFVAMLIAERMGASAIVDELRLPQTRGYGSGRTYHHIGMAEIANDLIRRLLECIANSDEYWEKPKRRDLYLAALALMIGADDEDIHQAFERMHEMIRRPDQ
jgi:sugar-specific transcriptional regulator TrmB